MARPQALTRAEFLVRFLVTDLDRLRSRQRTRLLEDLGKFCRNPAEALWGEMEPAPTWGDVPALQHSVRWLLEGILLPPRRPSGPSDLDLLAAGKTETLERVEGADITIRNIGVIGQSRSRHGFVLVRSTPRDILRLLALGVVTRGDRLPAVARCGDPHCPRKWFVGRGKKRFCDDRCRVRVFVRRKRAAQAKRNGGRAGGHRRRERPGA